ncbi:MAG: 50S ribosomal protein L18 [Candidatus Magasanikbacteria bacterium]|nr:50S ribosomal protein L18 [Candidatus Magasanikbacteria bacterium]
MKKANITRDQKRNRRRARVRAVISGTATRPRLNVTRSLTGFYMQLINDEESKTLVSAHSKKDAKEGDAGDRSGKIKVAYILGKVLAEKAKAAGITSIVFDRAGYQYHGRVKAAAEGARDGGLVF